MAGLVLAAPAPPTTDVLDDKSYLDVFIGNLENELKAELKELRETPEKPFVQPYVIDDAPVFDENLTKTNELLAIATLHYKAQDNIVVALENALKKAKKSRARHDLKYEKAMETIKSSKFRIAKLEQEMEAIVKSQGKHKAEMEAVYNASRDIAEREYLANVQEAQFDLEDRTTKEKIDYDSARARLKNHVHELEQERHQLRQSEEATKKKSAAEMKFKPSDAILGRLEKNAAMLMDEYNSEKQRKKKIKELEDEISTKENDVKKANEALKKAFNSTY